MTSRITDDDWAVLNKGREILRGYDRKIKISLEFLDDLKINDVSTYDFLDYADQILMIHGTKDEMAPIETTRIFSENNIIELIEVENADHPFSNPQYMDFAIQKIQEFFNPEND
jgi:alpha/beta superfamily hydrolase